jgi:hypothetical protein
MAKRFTDTGTWQDEWFMNLPPEYKLAYMFIKDNCDQAGIWRPNKKLADMMIGCEVNWDDFLIEAGERVKIVSSGYWWLTKFCDFQYGKLSEKCKPHIKVIEILNKYQLLDRVCKGYANPIDRVEEKEEDKEEEKEKEEKKKRKKEKPETAIIYPFNTEAFLNHWNLWKKYLLKIDKAFNGEISEQAALKELSRIAKDEETAIRIIEKSLSNGWKDLYKLKGEDNGKSTVTTSGINSFIDREFEKRGRS